MICSRWSRLNYSGFWARFRIWLRCNEVRTVETWQVCCSTDCVGSICVNCVWTLANAQVERKQSFSLWKCNVRRAKMKRSDLWLLKCYGTSIAIACFPAGRLHKCSRIFDYFSNERIYAWLVSSAQCVLSEGLNIKIYQIKCGMKPKCYILNHAEM